MQFTKFALIASLAAAASAWTNETWVTTTVDVFTTVCPAATTITHNGQTFTATASQTLTITNCPCTVSFKPTVTPVVICSTCTSAPSFANATTVVPVPTTTPAGTIAAATTTKAPSFTGAANKAVAGSAAALGGLLGVAAYFL